MLSYLSLCYFQVHFLGSVSEQVKEGNENGKAGMLSVTDPTMGLPRTWEQSKRKMESGLRTGWGSGKPCWEVPTKSFACY